MPAPLTEAEFAKLLTEKDEFKLAIRGHTAIEADIDAAIADAFTGDVPAELRAARFGIRLALVVALGLVPPENKPLFEKLATLRNKFAHGEISAIDANRAHDLAEAATSTLPPSEERDGITLVARERPRFSLVWALIAARALIAATTEAHRRRREEEERIVANHRVLHAQRSALLSALTRAEQPDE